MERRALLAIALSVGVLLIWQAWLSPPPAPRGPATGEGSGVESREPSGGGAPRQSESVAGGGGPRALPKLRGGGGVVATVKTPLYSIGLGAEGGAREWQVSYRGMKGIALGEALPPLSVGVRGPGGVIEVVPLQVEGSGLTLGPERPTGRVVASGRTTSGVGVRRVLEFSAESYAIGVVITVEGARAPAAVELYWTGPSALVGRQPGDPWVTVGEGPERQQVLGRLLVGRRGGEPEVFEAPAPTLKDGAAAAELKEPMLVPAAMAGGERPWVAMENDYFIAALMGSSGGVLRGREADLVETGVAFRVEPGAVWEGRATLYVGPKEWVRLSALGVGLEEAQARNYGHLLWIPWLPMWWFCVPLLWLMNWFGTRLPGQNYGVAIILLTVLVKGLFYPLSVKSMRSMKQMQLLQPQVNALRSKYRSDPQRFQREQMDLFRKHRVNPMGGCLPMVVQVPIFYALYLTLQYSVELQGAAFGLWIQDLSRKDPYYVLPILMGVSMLVQQRMTPTVGDPRQAKIMLVMPVIFTFMFLEFPTGLVLYWFVNNVLSIAQQYLIDRSASKGGIGARGSSAG